MSQANHFTHKIVPFYLGQQPDAQGRTIQTMWNWGFETLETVHDYIQWLFPLGERSAFNLHAPLVDADVIRAFQHDPTLRQNLLRSLDVMLRFYGLQRQEQGSTGAIVTRAEHYPQRQFTWLGRFNHNYLRITRMLKCLTMFGLVAEARAFYQCLQDIYRESGDRIGAETFQYWTNAVRPPD
ncbi:opioid growth factor receptor-related protein [Leptolyngbya sp. KIOST-1]|uniref:opioid growth factor receptor-related protein n=1 Tax=Leptolyngbya sp. KIOST-1 TaxID=1229172 RepID=UPI00056A7542|nr:opioid growth factor receptor-related protein [Leptolyngbya sp. KIOST-1]